MVYNHKEYMREYNKRRKEELKQYWQTPQGKRSKRICEWKRQYKLKGDLDKVYDIFINTENCEICKRKLTDDKFATSTRRTLDHCHKSGYMRFICCHACNTKMAHAERKYEKCINLLNTHTPLSP